MFNVYYSITEDIFKKDLENTVNLIINYSKNTLDIITIHETMNSKLDDAYDVVLKNLIMIFSITFNHAHNVVLKNFIMMLSITLNHVYNVILKNLAVMLNIILNHIHDVVLKNLIIMLNITFDYIYDVVSKNFIMTLSTALFKTFIIFVIC